MLCLQISKSIFIFLMYIVISKSFISRFSTCCKMVVRFGVQGTSAYFLFEKVVLCASMSYDWKWVVLTLSKSPLFKIPKSTLVTLRDYTVFVTKNLSLSLSLSFSVYLLINEYENEKTFASNICVPMLVLSAHFHNNYYGLNTKWVNFGVESKTFAALIN